MNLFIVESPAKAKTIEKYLGNNFSVLASMGHIRELVPKDGSVDVNNDFKMKFQIISKSKKQVDKICSLAKKADKIYLASDPDREGEAIAEALYEVLISKKVAVSEQFYRITYTEITKKAILEALQKPRKIDKNLVSAQQSRQALDYLVGFSLSPVLWRKLPGSRSAGRVQSVALRMIVDREFEIKKFIPKEYWTIDCNLNTAKNESVNCRIIKYNENNFDTDFPKNQQTVNDICDKINKIGTFKVIKNETKDFKRQPYPPFTTALLQQDAVRKLGFSSKKTMTIAQHLYEQGLITYMRTDGMTINDNVLDGIRNIILKQFGKEYLPNKSIHYKTKQKNAQEAHEAIHPTNILNSPEVMSSKLEHDDLKLYDLIWKRTVACQMMPAIFVRQVVDLNAHYDNINGENINILGRINGSKLKFNGYLAVYNVKNENFETGDEDDEDRLIPNMEVGDVLNIKKILKEQHFTNPPARYTEASLIKTLEAYGIGRPSTYATIISVLQDREYTKLDRHQFIPTSRGIIVSVFLKQFFTKYVEYDFTAKLEEDLDIISNGKLNKIEFLTNFWIPFSKNVNDVIKTDFKTTFKPLNDIIVEYFLDTDEKKKCKKCGNEMILKSSRNGCFFGCSNYPNCTYTASIDDSDINKNNENNENLTIDHKVYGKVIIKNGPYGRYCEYSKDGKIKKVSLPNEEITPDILEFYFSLPLKLGKDNDGNEIITNVGRFGPYILVNKKFYSYKDKPYHEITLQKAIDTILKANNNNSKKIKKNKIINFNFKHLSQF